MSVEQAIAAAAAGRIALLQAPGEDASAIAARLGEDARVVDVDELPFAGPETGEVPVVVRRAEGLAGLLSDVWVGPWVLRAWRARCRPSAVLLLATTDHPYVGEVLGAQLEAQVFGAAAAPPPPAAPDDDGVDTDAVRAALDAVGDGGARAVSPEHAAMLGDLAFTGFVEELWRVPFLVQVVDDRRFKRPFVESDPEVLRFYEAHQAFVGGLGMLEAAEYELKGRHPKDLRVFASALGLRVWQVARVFRRMDRAALVVSSPREDGLGARPNLDVVPPDGDPDLDAAVAAVQRLRGLRAALDEATSPTVHTDAARVDDPMASLFASLGELPAVATDDDERAGSRPEAAPATPAEEGVEPPGEPEVPADLPDHLPGLAALARGELAEAREALGAVDGDAAAEARLLATFRYDWIDDDGTEQRRYQLPAEIVTIAGRVLELERVPASRLRATVDEAFPEAFVEAPRPGLIEVFFDDGPLHGTHRLRELPGRRRFERDRLVGARAVQARLAAGEFSEQDPGDPGWASLAEVLRARDAGDGELAWEALQRVDVDVDLDTIRAQVIELLPLEHEERAALEARREEQRRAEELRTIRGQIARAIRGRGTDDEPGHDAVRAALAGDRAEELAETLSRQADAHPRDPSPHLWLGRLRLAAGDLSAAEQGYRLAAELVSSSAKRIDWWFELAAGVLASGRTGWFWGSLKRFLADRPDPRLVDERLEGWFDDGLLTDEHAAELRKVLERRGARRMFPRTYERLGVEDDVDPWKKALLGFKVGD